jgi:hypothetical protein
MSVGAWSTLNPWCRKIPDKKNTPYRVCLEIFGGSAWESNPPDALFTRHSGFEAREAHQAPWHFREEE